MSKRDKLVTVLVPTLGNSSIIKNLFTGLKNQDYNNFEVLIVTLKPPNEIQKIIKKFMKHFEIYTSDLLTSRLFLNKGKTERTTRKTKQKQT